MKKALTYSIICFFLVVISGIASIAIYRWCPLCVDELKEIGPAGDAIAGISAIILGAFGVAATFAAFYIQYKANISLHNDSLKEGFDRKFFELVHLFAQSTNTLQIKVEKGTDFRDKTGNPYEYIQGKNVFKYFHDDFFILYNELVGNFNHIKSFLIEHSDKLIRISFLLVYYGNEHLETLASIQQLEAILDSQKKSSNITDDELFAIAFAERGLKSKKDNYAPSLSNSSYNEVLCHYFKQLYIIIKFVIDAKGMTDEQKKSYFNMLRGQLSFNEQLMLFYSWYTGLEKELSKAQMKEVFCEFGLINDLLNNSVVDGIDIPTILSAYEDA